MSKYDYSFVWTLSDVSSNSQILILFLVKFDQGADNREISLYVQRRICVVVGRVFSVKINSYWKSNYTFEIFYLPAIKL